MLRAQGSDRAPSLDPPTMAADRSPELVVPDEPSFDARVAMADAVELATDVYLPDRVGVRGAPTVLIRTPYGRRGEIDAAPECARLLNADGFAVVAQDVRGKFDSGGVRDPFRHELDDGQATLEWIAGQTWSDGSVVPLGASYAGFAAWAAAATRHPALRGVVARVTTCHIAGEWLYRQGLFRLQMNAGWAPFAWGQPQLEPFEPDWQSRPVSALGFGDDDAEILRRWIRTPPDAPAWVEHGLAGTAALSRRVQVPVLHWGGWWDLLSRGQLREWRALAGTATGGDQRLIMGATDHDFHPFAVVAERSTGPLATSADRQGVDLGPALPFLDAVVRDKSPGSGARWELTHGGWREDASWPPPAVHPVRLHLADGAHAAYGPEGGVLAHRPDTLPMTVGWTHDPSELVPSLETFVWGTLANDYPDERDAQIRDDVLTFSGQPAAEPLDVVGLLHVHLHVQAACAQTQLAVTLCDVQPDGRALRVVEGGCLVGDASTWQTVSIELGPTAYRLQPDHRLRLAVAASSFPRYLWSPGDGLDPWSAGPGPSVEHRLQLGRTSYVELSVLD